jgi:zinc D-Ala-D-Ala carboxypeptidase
VDWSQYPNFSKSEFRCKETGENGMQPEFMALLQQLRNRYGKPMLISSGYRSPRHSIEARKAQAGTHAQGIACDVAVSGADAQLLVKLALDLGFTGIGVSQKAGGARFIHLDTAPRRAIWSY